MNVLVVAAHPDDEVLGCGGTMARLAREGHCVDVAVLGEGETARTPRRKGAGQTALRALRASARRSAGILGLRGIDLGDLPDNRFDTIPLLDIVKRVEALIERLRPRVVYTHHPGDLNIDHAITHRAVVTATRPMPGSPVEEVYSFEIPSSTEWAFHRDGGGFRPSVFIGIAGTLEAKVRAMGAYGGEVRPFPHPRSAEALRAIAARWGSVAGLPAAEAFEPVRVIRNG